MHLKKRITFEEFKDIFSKLTGLSISFIDSNADFIRSADKSEEFCRMVGEFEKQKKVSNCWVSNFKACRKAIAGRKPIVYSCHAGLAEIVVPVFFENTAIGAIITGQVRIKNRSKYRKIRNPVPTESLSRKLAVQFAKIREIPEEELKAAAELLFLMADKVFKSDLIKLFQEKNDLETANMNSVLVRLTSFVRENFKNPDLSLEEAAKQVNLSPYYISHIFTRELNISFIDFLTKVRLDEAKAQLRTRPEASVKEIAYDIGYSDPYYFGKVFKKYVKLTPLEYRGKNQA